MEIVRKTIENDLEYLRQVSTEVDLSNDEYKKKLDVLRQFCSETACFALAAVQVGIPERMIYLKNTSVDAKIEDMDHDEARILINPVITERTGETEYWEACLSCLDFTGLVRRPYKMKVEYYDENGEKHNEIFEGFEATVLSHEYDHLNGILHMDIAKEILEMTQEERKIFRETHHYEVLRTDGEYDPPKVKKLKK